MARTGRQRAQFPLAPGTGSATRPTPHPGQAATAAPAHTGAPGRPKGARQSAVPDASDALAYALERVGDRWTLLVVAALLNGPKRFGELQAEVPGVATNVLTARLRELERQGLVVGTPYSERPLRFEYELAAAGAELAGVLRLFAAWGAGPGGGAEPPTHSVCGTALEVRYWCPTCERLAEDDDEVWA